MLMQKHQDLHGELAIMLRAVSYVCPTALQVKIAEHITTSHKVAIKILNKKKIKQMDMEEKGDDYNLYTFCQAGYRAKSLKLACPAVRREIKILRLFMHPHIIRLYEVIETTNDIYVVMEYVKVISQLFASSLLSAHQSLHGKNTCLGAPYCAIHLAVYGYCSMFMRLIPWRAFILKIILMNTL